MDNRCWCGLEIPEDGDCQHGTDIKTYPLHPTDKEKIADLTAELERVKKELIDRVGFCLDELYYKDEVIKRLRKGIEKICSEQGYIHDPVKKELRALLKEDDNG